MPKINAIIFDLDGTLLNSLADLANAMNTALEKEGLPTHEVSAYTHFIGDGVDTLVQRVVPEAVRADEARCAGLREEMKAVYGETWHDHSRAYSGIQEALSYLQAARIPLAVLSNKPQRFTKACVEHFFPDTAWASIEGARDGRALKPEPDAALGIAKGLGIPAGEIAFVGDSATDIRTAVNAGMLPIGVTWGFRDQEELERAGAQQCFDDPEALTLFLISNH